MKKTLLPMNLQFFAEPEEKTGEGEGTGTGQDPTKTQSNQSPAIDYEKIQRILDGTLSAKEDTVLKAYFKQQGLSQQEAEQAMVAFKEEKAKKQPDISAIQQQIADSQEMARQAIVEKEAMLLSGELGIELKTMPYLLKLADVSNVTDDNGNINKETLKTALGKVLEDLPQLKKESGGEQIGFRQVGSSGKQDTTDLNDQLASIFGNKK